MVFCMFTMRVPKFLHWLLVTVACLPTLVDMAILLRLRTEDQETQQRREAILNIPKSQKEIDKYATSVYNIYIYIDFRKNLHDTLAP